MLLLLKWELMFVYLEENKLWKNVYIRETFCPLVLNLLLVYRIWFMFFISLLFTSSHIHLHVWFILDQFAVDRPNFIWTQQVNFIGDKAVNTVRGSWSLWDLPLMTWLDKKGKHFIRLAKKTRFHLDGAPGSREEAAKRWRCGCRAQRVAVCHRQRDSALLTVHTCITSFTPGFLFLMSSMFSIPSQHLLESEAVLTVPMCLFTCFFPRRIFLLPFKAYYII